MAPKYRQPGYRDAESGDSRPRPPREREDRMRPAQPRGRGLGAPTRERFACAVCGHEQAAPAADDPTASCASCEGALHSCTHCRHFDTAARFQCRAPVEAPLSSKASANECRHFEPRVAMAFDESRPAGDDPRAAFDDLFKGL